MAYGNPQVSVTTETYSNRNMYYMAALGTIKWQIEAGLFYYLHLKCQQWMRNPKWCRDGGWHHVLLSNHQTAWPMRICKKAVMTEVEAHIKNDNWLLIKRDKVPPYTDILLSAMCCKRYRMTNNVKGHKNNLNLPWGKQVYMTTILKPKTQSWQGLLYNSWLYYPSSKHGWCDKSISCKLTYASPHWMWYVHGATSWYWDKSWKLQGLCSETTG